MLTGARSWSGGSATASSASARAWTSTCRRTPRRRRRWATRSTRRNRSLRGSRRMGEMEEFEHSEAPSAGGGQEPPRRGLGGLRRRGIYLLPNLFTTAALFFGFFAIVRAMNGQFEQAAIAIFVAMVLDGLDGRVARLTHTTSEFGAQYDSLSDMVSFGVAPALVMYEWALKDMGKLGWIASFVYCVGAALRLARFNTNIDVVDKRFFQGLPSPMAAAFVAGLVWVFDDLGIDRELWLKLIAWVFTMYAGITMVTSVPFYSFK